MWSFNIQLSLQGFPSQALETSTLSFPWEGNGLGERFPKSLPWSICTEMLDERSILGSDMFGKWVSFFLEGHGAHSQVQDSEKAME